MNILQRYIALNVVTSTLLVLFVLLGLYTFMDFITELDDLGVGNYHLPQIASYIGMTTPKRIYELLPVAALLGSVIGLGNMASQSELVAIRAAGMSVKQINKAVLFVAIGIMLLAVVIGEVIRPVTEQKALEAQSFAQTGTAGIRTVHGFWTRDDNHFNHIGNINADGSFSDITIYEFDGQNQLRVLTKAKSAVYENREWLLSDVIQSHLSKDGVNIRSVTHANWRSQLNPGMLNIVVVPPEFLPVWDLLAYIEYLQTNHQAVASYKLAFWTKVMMPLSSAVMVLLAVPFIFGPLRSSPIGGRILVGSLIGIGFHLFNQSFQQMGLVFGMAPWFAAALPTALFAMIAWVMTSRVR